MNQKEVEAKIRAFLPEDAYSKEEIIAYLIEDDEKLLEKAFPEPQQRIVIVALFNRVLDMLQYHTEEEEDPHEKEIGVRLDNLDAKLRNHRHDTTKQYSAKPEF
jgi:hypothetical protein